ncbi:MAG: DUF3565 domain-containing protein [Pseudomonadota bacterium]|nr:DUF3565 domain-containing protein [Pseudomonadota bacterium]
MDRKIVGFHQDEEQHWVAQLECGHNQHVRHDPPWTNRPWVITPEGRARVLGQTLSCRKCDAASQERLAASQDRRLSWKV